MLTAAVNLLEKLGNVQVNPHEVMGREFERVRAVTHSFAWCAAGKRGNVRAIADNPLALWWKLVQLHPDRRHDDKYRLRECSDVGTEAFAEAYAKAGNACPEWLEASHGRHFDAIARRPHKDAPRDTPYPNVSKKKPERPKPTEAEMEEMRRIVKEAAAKTRVTA